MGQAMRNSFSRSFEEFRHHADEPSKLLGAQRRHRIDTRGAPCGDPRRQSSHHHGGDEDDAVGEGIGGLNLEQSSGLRSRACVAFDKADRLLDCDG
jgi:hypothetical protein